MDPTFRYFVRNSLTLEHNIQNLRRYDLPAIYSQIILLKLESSHQYVTMTHRWWIETSYVSKVMLQSK